MGVLLPNLPTSLALKEEGIRGVHIGPGATALTLIFLLARDRAKDRVKVIMLP